jgi:hypothetical protein
MSNTTGRHTPGHPRPTSAPLNTPPTDALPAAADHGDAALKELQLDVERLIDAYEIDVACHTCKHVHQRSISWLRMHSTMECEKCQSAIVLRTSLMNDEMRRVGRQLRKLQQQLGEMITRATGILGQ